MVTGQPNTQQPFEVTLVRSDVTKIKTDHQEFNARLIDVEIYCQNNSESFDDYAKTTDQKQEQITSLKQENVHLNHQLAEVKSNYTQLKKDFLELQTRSMQENLLFFGIPGFDEQSRSDAPTGVNNATSKPEPENVEENLRRFMTNELNLESPEYVANLKFDRVHRLGSRRINRQNPRPIIAKFERYSDREKVRKAGIDLNSNPISKYKVREQFPKEIEDRRKLLYPVMYRLKANPDNPVNLVRDKLYVNGQLYIPENDPDYRIPAPTENDYSQNDKRPKSRPYIPLNRMQRFNRSNHPQGAIPKYGGNNALLQTPQVRPQTPVSTANRFESLADDSGVNTERYPGQKHKTISPLSDQLSPKKQKDAGIFTNISPETKSQNAETVVQCENRSRCNSVDRSSGNRHRTESIDSNERMETQNAATSD